MSDRPTPPQRDTDPAPLLARKHYQAGSVFRPENLLKEARRQKAIPEGTVPPICVLDPDGDIAANLRRDGRARPSPTWACYHTGLDEFTQDGRRYGIIGGAVGASFAVLVAEELFVSGCQLLISITSSGLIVPIGPPPYFVLIERALRDEGTSYHYLPPAPYSHLDPGLADLLRAALPRFPVPVYPGAVWTTDAPFRETAPAIAFAEAEGILAVEMEAAALYAFAAARQRPVVCFAQVTNQMGTIDGDFEKGQAEGSHDALRLIGATAAAWLAGH